MKRRHEKDRRCYVPQGSSVEDAIVFVVDDDPDVRDALSSLFESVGLSVQTFASATEMLLRELPSVPSCLLAGQ
jgi:FixJ family two-component response regulator